MVSPEDSHSSHRGSIPSVAIFVNGGIIQWLGLWFFRPSTSVRIRLPLLINQIFDYGSNLR